MFIELMELHRSSFSLKLKIFMIKYNHGGIMKTMQIKKDDILYDVIIEKKSTTKNSYIRVKDDLKIYVTCNIKTTDKYIVDFLRTNYNGICKMIDKELKRKEDSKYFFYLGKKYDIVYTDSLNVSIGQDKVYLNKNIDIDKWYKKQASLLFKERLNFIYNFYSRKIPYPSLWIRKMTSRWGVCNTKNHNITLNLELIKKDIKYLDYVIIHELSHLIHPNHSKSFWALVEENCPNYKKIRKEMKEF